MTYINLSDNGVKLVTAAAVVITVILFVLIKWVKR